MAESLSKKIKFDFKLSFFWYQSAQLTILMLMLALITGFYLLFFYRISTPYESLKNIHENIFLGRFTRSLHRLSSDLTIVFALLHLLKMFLEKKSFGARAFTWITGVFLFFAILLSGWTGYVMIWDEQALTMAEIGAKLLDATQLFSDSLLRSFYLGGSLPGSFYFMNLFLHVAVPLGVIFGIWLHTSRLARVEWLPEKKLGVIILFFLFLAIILNPALLLQKANALQINDKNIFDIFYSLPFLLEQTLGGTVVLMLVVLVFFILLLIPVLTVQPSLFQNQKSVHDEIKCAGCEQCTQDCPFEAISMAPRTIGKGSAIVAKIESSRCVGCGICVASCTQDAIGPPGRSGVNQFKRIEVLTSQYVNAESVIVFCTRQNSRRLGTELKGVPVFEVPCAGELHSNSVRLLLSHFKKVMLYVCDAVQCQSRDGVKLLEARLFENREPALSQRVDRSRIIIQDVSKLKRGSLIQDSYKLLYRAPIFCLVLALGIFLTQRFSFLKLPTGQDLKQSVIRLSIRHSPPQIKQCHREAQATTLSHMQPLEVCDRKYFAEKIEFWIDGELLLTEELKLHRFDQGAPISLLKDFAVSSGEHKVKIQLTPVGTNEIKVIEESKTLTTHSRQVSVVTFSR